MNECSATRPLSWLKLEHYRLGELDVESENTVEEHVASCSACAGALRYIESDTVAIGPLRVSSNRAVIEWPSLRIWAAGLGAATAAVFILISLYRLATRPCGFRRAGWPTKEAK